MSNYVEYEIKLIKQMLRECETPDLYIDSQYFLSLPEFLVEELNNRGIKAINVGNRAIKVYKDLE